MRAGEGTQKSELLRRLFRSAARTGALFLGDGKVCCFDYPSFLPGERIAGLSIPSREDLIPAEEPFGYASSFAAVGIVLGIMTTWPLHGAAGWRFR